MTRTGPDRTPASTSTRLALLLAPFAGGVMNFGSNLGGMVSPALTPWLAERIGWEAALTLTAGLAVVAGLLWLGARPGASALAAGSSPAVFRN